MPSKNPRVMLTLNPNTDKIYKDLAKVREMPKATLIAEYLDALVPHAEQMYLALKAVEDKKDPAKHLNKMLANAFKDAADVLDNQIDWVNEAKK